MWKLGLIAALCLTPVYAPAAVVTNGVIKVMEELPPYAKWGQLAMKETKKKYPDAAIVDYLHIGRESDNSQTTERFKLWLRGSEREFGVFIDIRFSTETEEIIEITFRETDR